MTKYHVMVPEVHYQTVEIEANSPEEAASLVNDGEGEHLELYLKYSHTLEEVDARWWVVNTETKERGQYAVEGL